MVLYKGKIVSEENLFPIGFSKDTQYFTRRDLAGIYKLVGRELFDVNTNEIPVDILDRANEEFGFYFNNGR